jgi:hypothetical protein
MNSLDGTFLLIGLFFLRLAAPLVLTLLFGIAMNRMLERMDYRIDR